MITELLSALNAGQQLSNSAGWKNAQATTNAIAAVMAGVLAVLSLAGIHPLVTSEQLALIGGGIAGILGVLNTYTAIATSKTVGLPPRAGATPATDKSVEHDNLMG